MTRRFTGFHVTAILLAFFGVVIAVNVTMAVAASRTFAGKVVDNSYVASQQFNRWLAEGRAQQRLGWRSRLGLNASRQVTLELQRQGIPLGGAEVRAVARHPLGQASDVTLDFVASDGRYLSRTALPPGRWRVDVEVRRDGQTMRLAEALS